MEDSSETSDMKFCCSVCLDSYDGARRRPRVLPCGHTYCCRCIQCQISDLRIICPECRKQHTARYSEIFPPNYAMENFLPPPSLDTILNVSDLNALSLSPSKRSLIENDQVYAVQRCEGETRYAKIGLDLSGDICVHALRTDVAIPEAATLLEYNDVVGDDLRPGLTFLDLGTASRRIGRLRIRLNPEGNLPLNFHRLCTGEMGPSYATSMIWCVWGRYRDDEFLVLGDYEKSNGLGGKAVVPGVDWRMERDRTEIYGNLTCEAGAIAPSLLAYDEERASQFKIYTRDRRKLLCKGRFAMVEDGLDVLEKVISRYDNRDISKVFVTDCGIILPRS